MIKRIIAAGKVLLMMKFVLYPDAPSKAITSQKAQISLIDGTVKIEDKSIKGIPTIGYTPSCKRRSKIDLKHPYY